MLYQPTQKVSQSDLNETVNILTNRVDALGVSGAQVGTQGQYIVVSIPGRQGPPEDPSTIGQTAQLYFRPVLCYAPAYERAEGEGRKVITEPGPLPTTARRPTSWPRRT